MYSTRSVQGNVCKIHRISLEKREEASESVQLRTYRARGREKKRCPPLQTHHRRAFLLSCPLLLASTLSLRPDLLPGLPNPCDPRQPDSLFLQLPLSPANQPTDPHESRLHASPLALQHRLVKFFGALAAL
jgi:hypothetical protein